MAFNRPTLAEIRTQIESSIRSALGLGPLLARSVLSAIAAAIAGVVHQQHGHLDWISRQAFPDTADAEELDRLGGIYGVVRKTAGFAAGFVEVTGTIGAAIPSGTRWRLNDGTEFELDGVGVVLTAGVQSLPIQAVVAGIDGNAPNDAVLTLTSPIASVQTAATAAGALTGGATTESDDAYRARILERMQSPPRGGAAQDYVFWAKEIADITRAWVTPEYAGAGTVAVHIVTDDAPGGIIPGGAKITEVQDHIDALRPVTAIPTVLAPTLVPLDFTITVVPDTPEVRDAVEASLADFIRRAAVPSGTLYLSQIREAISVAVGESNHVLTSPAADVSVDFGELTQLGDITWV